MSAKVRVQILEDESRQHAALAQNRVAAANAPAAVPTQAVTAEQAAKLLAEAAERKKKKRGRRR